MHAIQGRIIGAAILVVLVFTFSFASAGVASAQGVLQAVAVQVKPGQLETYRKAIGDLRGVMKRLGVPATVHVWQATLAGPATGSVFVVLEHASLAAFADGSAKMAGDAEWRQLIAGLDGVRTIVSQSLYRELSGESASISGDSVLQTITVRVAPGRIGDYLAAIEKLGAVGDRVGSRGQVRAWQATMAGDSTGNVVVGVMYPSLAAFAEDTGKTRNDAEWQKIVSGLDGVRTIVSSGLARNIDP